MEKVWRLIINNLDTSLAIALSIIAAVLSTFGILEAALLPAIAATLALLAASIIRDRTSRDALLVQINKLETILQISGHKPSADLFFTANTSEIDLIARSREEIWLVQETGSLVVEQNLEPLERLIRSGGTVKIVIAGNSRHIIEAIAFRNKNLDASMIKTRQDDALNQFISLMNATKGCAGTLQIRRIPYPLDITAVFIDPESSDPSNRRGLIRMAGFHNYFKNKRDFHIAFSSEPETYQFFSQQFVEMWQNSEPIDLLVAN
ncbi:MAG: hypothetical protein HY862_13935 [Chloroflexi bacterium]|nr:hypothetical protein [Chloroflexota bacterium]